MLAKLRETRAGNGVFLNEEPDVEGDPTVEKAERAHLQLRFLWI